jgi:hypothetical protein
MRSRAPRIQNLRITISSSWRGESDRPFTRRKSLALPTAHHALGHSKFPNVRKNRTDEQFRLASKIIVFRDLDFLLSGMFVAPPHVRPRKGGLRQ